jgi:hypothetical protein
VCKAVSRGVLRLRRSITINPTSSNSDSARGFSHRDTFSSASAPFVVGGSQSSH